MTNKFKALALAGALLAATGVSTANASGNNLAPQLDNSVAQEVHEVEPNAVPAIVGTAFATGAAGAAGAAVGGWVADKLIGIFGSGDPVEAKAELDTIFD